MTTLSRQGVSLVKAVYKRLWQRTTCIMSKNLLYHIKLALVLGNGSITEQAIIHTKLQPTFSATLLTTT